MTAKEPAFPDCLIVGFDPASPGQDFSSVCFRVGKEIHFLPEPFASAWLRHTEDERTRYTAAISALEDVKRQVDAWHPFPNVKLDMTKVNEILEGKE